MQPRPESSWFSTGHVSRLLIKAGMSINATGKERHVGKFRSFLLLLKLHVCKMPQRILRQIFNEHLYRSK